MADDSTTTALQVCDILEAAFEEVHVVGAFCVDGLPLEPRQEPSTRQTDVRVVKEPLFLVDGKPLPPTRFVVDDSGSISFSVG
jgi:hypothetical protein